MITSRDNPKVKWMRSLHDGTTRQHEGCFLVEGIILIEDALQAGVKPRLVLYDPTTLQGSRRGRRLLERLVNIGAEEASTHVLQSVCDTVTPQGVVAAVPLLPAPAALNSEGLAVVLDGLRDPGNAGSIVRSAEAAGCVAVIATSDTVDLYSPKVVRAAMGAHWRLPLLINQTWPALTALLVGRNIYLAETRGGISYYDVDWTKPSALIVGNETEGARPEARRCATGRVSIPMPGPAESLNAAVAAAIIIFEAVRQTVCQSPAHDRLT